MGMAQTGITASCLAFLVLEAFILGSPIFATTAPALAAGTFTNLQTGSSIVGGITATPPSPPQTASCGWNPFCTISNTWSAIVYFVQQLGYYWSVVTAPFVTILGAFNLVVTYSIVYPWLGWINGVVIVILIISIVHGLI